MVPRATYRLQFHEGFPLSEARALVPYLHELGISHIYASPLFKARPHSTHGYDTCDFNQLNPELGAEAGLEKLVSTLREHGMGLVLDIVPNHMGIGGPENSWWWDVLARGPASRFAKYFDIDWSSPDPRLHGKVLAPVLRDRYHRVLANHELQIENGGDTCLLRYGESAFPINAQSLKSVKTSPAELNANPDALDALIEQQFYRLTWYGRGDKELNYRRFFNITSLPGLCMEDEQVFNQVFALTRQWLERGWLDGLRVDHPDGLRDPEQFLQRLKNIAPNAWIVVEKILERDEFLPASWPVAGTTGYDFLNHVGGLWVDPKGEHPFTDLYLLFSGSTTGYHALAREKKRLVLRSSLAAEVDHLTCLLLRITMNLSRYRDFTREELCGAVVELTACFSVYRSYVRPENGTVHESDADYILKAVAEARRTRPDLPTELFEFLSDLLLLKPPQGELQNEFVARFQQVSSATMAKGVEDTAFYCFNRFVALNEVGGNPGRFGVGVDEFHKFCRHQQTHWPATMLATSTHDTKRGEDVRARLSLLSEMPEKWRETVGRWSAMNKNRRHGWPDRNAEYLYYQTLVGAWPLPTTRALAYMQKAAHEAKEYTRWSNINTEYDSALREFVMASLTDPEFVADVKNFVAPLLQPGCINSLAQTLLKLTAPGVPDFYQGAELWNLNLVDPDNRRAVDFVLRQQLLAKAATLSAEEAWKEWQSGLPKLWLIRRVLNWRAQRPDLFAASANYEAMKTQGHANAHTVVFKRGENLITLVPRLVLGLQDDWGDTTLELPPGTWRNVLTDETLPQKHVLVSALLGKFPVALLAREGNP